MTKYLFVISTLLLLSCGKDAYFESNVDIPEGPWNHEASVDFTFSIEDTLALYDLELDVHHLVDFKFQNLYLELKTIFPDDQKVEDVLSLQMTGEFADWIGDCSSDQCEAHYMLQKGTRFKTIGDYQLSINQHSRLKQLEGISGLTFRVIKH